MWKMIYWLDEPTINNSDTIFFLSDLRLSLLTQSELPLTRDEVMVINTTIFVIYFSSFILFLNVYLENLW